MKRIQPPEPVHYADLREVVLHAGTLFPETTFFFSSDPDMPHVTGRELRAYCGRFGVWAQREELSGAHFAILGPNGAAWLSCYFAVICSGQVAVPLHLGTKAEELESCIRRSDSAVLLYDRSCEAEAEALRQAIPELKTLEFHALLQALSAITEETWPELGQDDLAALYFTSGTTAQSRCVMLTHRNMGSHCSAALSLLPLSPTDSGLSVMPPSHTFEIMSNIVGVLHCGGKMYINESLLTVKSNLKEYEPSHLVVVPLVLQSLRREILRTAKRAGKLDALQKKLERNALCLRTGEDLRYDLFRSASEVVGRNLRYFLCGGATLDPELIAFFRCLGIMVIQGYGITECSPVVAINLPYANRYGSIGRTLPCCETAIIDGEICVRGDSVSPGYYKDPAANAEAYRDGWFHTGDLGRKDADGYLWFTGRKKNLIVLSNGENVSPEMLEERLYRVDGVVDALVYEEKGKITAEIYADRNVLPDRESVWQEIDRINRALAPHEHIGELVLRSEPFEKTATQKIKRY